MAEVLYTYTVYIWYIYDIYVVYIYIYDSFNIHSELLIKHKKCYNKQFENQNESSKEVRGRP